MKKFLTAGVFAALVATGAQAADNVVPEPTQDPAAPFRLFRSQNIHTLLKLDTRTGLIWQVQWGDGDHRFESELNSTALVAKGRAGRFTLYSTENIFTYILLDQDTGRQWQVQWGKAAERFVVPIQ